MCSPDGLFQVSGLVVLVVQIDLLSLWFWCVVQMDGLFQVSGLLILVVLIDLLSLWFLCVVQMDCFKSLVWWYW